MAQVFSPPAPAGAPAQPPATGRSDGSLGVGEGNADARYRSLVEQIPAVTFIAPLGGDEIELYVSPHIEALLGFSQREWLSDPFLWFKQLHPDDRELCNREFARGCLTGGPFRAEFRALTRNGDVVWVRGEARIVRETTAARSSFRASPTTSPNRNVPKRRCAPPPSISRRRSPRRKCCCARSTTA